MNFKIIPTAVFSRQAKRLSKKFPSLKTDLIQLGNKLLANPEHGTPLGNSCFKIRMTILPAKEKESIRDGELSELLKVLR